MEILTWTDPKYFRFCNALMRSIRYNENEHLIHLNLLDFNEEQFNLVQEMYKNDSKIHFIRTNYRQFKGKYAVNKHNKIPFYQNHRPRFFLEYLEKSKDGKLCTFGANGIIFSKLDFIENHLDEKDFVFLERQKNNIWTDSPKQVSGIDDLQDMVKQGLNLDKILDTTTGKVVLLGTHAMKNNDVCKDVLNRWIKLVENTESMNVTYSDMNYFVKSVIQYQMEKVRR